MMMIICLHKIVFSKHICDACFGLFWILSNKVTLLFYCWSIELLMIPGDTQINISSIHCVFKKFGDSYHKTNRTKDTNKFSLLPFKIVVIRYNARLTTFVQRLETISKGLLWNWFTERLSDNLWWHSRLQNVHLWWPPSSEKTGRNPQEPDQESKEGDQAQLPSSEPGIGAYGLHCVQGYS